MGRHFSSKSCWRQSFKSSIWDPVSLTRMGGGGFVLAEEPRNHSRGAKPWGGQEHQPLFQPHLQEDGSGGLGAVILEVDVEFDMLRAEQVCLSLHSSAQL